MTMYTAEPLINGFPATSDSHGAFGWSSVWLLRNGTHTVLVDTGGPAYVPVLRAELARRELTPDDITDVVLTHAHWDHCANFTIFPHARVWVGGIELDWASAQSPGAHFLSELHVAELARRAHADDGRVVRVNDEEAILPGITTIQVPGHTPGHLAVVVETSSSSLLLAGDAVKNIHELSTLEAASTMDEAESRRSISRIRDLMVTEGASLVPGHDVLLRADGSAFSRLERQGAQVTFFESAAGGVDRSIGSS